MLKQKLKSFGGGTARTLNKIRKEIILVNNFLSAVQQKNSIAFAMSNGGAQVYITLAAPHYGAKEEVRSYKK